MKRSLTLLLALCLISACRPKRPPAVATGGGAAKPVTTEQRVTLPQEPIPTGPDVQGVPKEGANEEILSDAQGENGPLADVHFDYDQATLNEEAKGLLEKHALWLQAHRDNRVTLEGHCDERGTVEYNLALGDKRAQAVREYLVSLGVVAQRLNPVSYGKEKPVDSGHTESAWAKNRRVHLLVTR